MVMEPTQYQNRFWPLSPRLWRRSQEYSKVVFEPRRPDKRYDHDTTPDLLRRNPKDLEHLNLEEKFKKPPLKKNDDVVVKLRTKKVRETRPNSLHVLLCPSSSGHYSSDTWRYTRVRSRRFVFNFFFFKCSLLISKIVLVFFTFLSEPLG